MAAVAGVVTPFIAGPECFDKAAMACKRDFAPLDPQGENNSK